MDVAEEVTEDMTAVFVGRGRREGPRLPLSPGEVVGSVEEEDTSGAASRATESSYIISHRCVSFVVSSPRTVVIPSRALTFAI